jgi:starch-binding outer membrane protein, SusD/RagB family
MNNLKKYTKVLLGLLLTIVFFSTSCKDFYNPDDELVVNDNETPTDWYEYRSLEMGLYALQQKLAEQLVVLGELRGDLLTVTKNADADLVEINNFTATKNNKYASPINFFKLIAGCNNFIRVMKIEHPEVMDKKKEATNYDKLYGEALCMRAWAYFNAVRIYGVVPFIDESLTTYDEVENFVNSSSIYIDSVYVIFNKDGFHNDTVYNKPDTLEKNLYNTEQIVDYFTHDLESRIKENGVGVKYNLDFEDPTWDVTCWNDYSMHALLGIMYLTQGDLTKAKENYFDIIKVSSDQYQLTSEYAGTLWSNIFSNMGTTEHIYVMWFNKTYFQQNEFQDLFETRDPHKYMLKPTPAAIQKWESSWRQQQFPTVTTNAQAAQAKMISVGYPGDYCRGIGASFLYSAYKGMSQMGQGTWMGMLQMKMVGDERTVDILMEDVDTTVYKYSIGKGTYDQDAFFIVYRAAAMHLYACEIMTYSLYYGSTGYIPETLKALGIVNDGSYFDGSVSRVQLGVRGRVGLGSKMDGLKINDFVFTNDPITNKITGYRNLTNNLAAKQKLFEEQIMDERARELAFEGERFYDLMRVAKRRNDPSYLASLVSAKYPSGQREAMYNLLLDENNWYIHYFD